MEYKVKKTTNLIEKELKEISYLFSKTFHKERGCDELKTEYSNNPMGYSLHGIVKDNGRIIGHMAYIPFEYLYRDNSFMACLSIDAMIEEDYRGKGIYRKLTEMCEQKAREESIKLRIGFPNENSYPVQIKHFGYKEVGCLDTYILPIKVGEVKKKLSLLNPISTAFANLLTGFSAIFSHNKKLKKAIIEKNREKFDSYRYKWFGGNYNIINRDNFSYVYKYGEYKGIKATFLLDINPLSKENFDRAVREIYNNRKDNSLILYVGNLPFKPLSMVKIPKKFAPKQFHFVMKVLDDTFLNNDLFEIKNWNLNLSNFDLI